ncbi:AraC family transcriptional regulator [uncultured Tenacibaculum sp.]|uniref:helix-turn-helix domain-containing protein n=1 Tax=uncultured Tenacibaculum sp. TaxID=174713 RepID=UPI001FB5585C|nr:helix-turn-helix transcriptional regulator [uncultured Tenacibaculum sp.]
MAETGLTPSKLILNSRMKLAKKLLSTSSLSIEEIAFKSGFNTLSGFSRKFKQEFGYPPTIYRKSITMSENLSIEWELPLTEVHLTHLNNLKKKISG